MKSSNYFLYLQAAQVYSPHRLTPNAVILDVPPNMHLGIEICVDEMAFGVRIAQIENDSIASGCDDLHVGAAILEISNHFVMESTLEEINAIIEKSKDEEEISIVYLAQDEVSALDRATRKAWDMPSRESRTNTLKAINHAANSNSPKHRQTSESCGGSGTPLDHTKDESEPSTLSPTLYDWEMGPNKREKLEARREELLKNDSLTADPGLMEEWLALLLARNTDDSSDDSENFDENNQQKSRNRKRNKWYSKIGKGFAKFLN